MRKSAAETRNASRRNEVDEVSVAEPISPELALVDPELAQRARLEFAPAPAVAVGRRTELRQDEPQQGEPPRQDAPPQQVAAATPLPARTRTRSRRALRIFGAVSFLALVALIGSETVSRNGAYVSVRATQTQPTQTPPTQTQARTETAGQTTPPATTRPRTSQPRTTAPAVPSSRPPPTLRVTTTPGATTQKPTQVGPSAAIPAPGNFGGAARSRKPPQATVLLSWRERPAATYYNVAVWHNGSRLLDVWPTASTVLLNRTGLEPGRYDWFVYPGIGSKAKARYGKLAAHGFFMIRR
jgi:hypothetical protein